MAETLTELVAKITTDAAGLKSGLSDAERKTEASSKKMADSLKKVGMAMAASGAAITAALGLMGKAAIDEEINIKRLATTINNSGTAYDSVKDSLESLIATTQRKTGIADDEQRDILGRLILITQDYGKALSLLPTVLDLAAVGEMDATTAATYLGKAYLELEEGAEEVSVRFGQASLQFKNMEDIQKRVAGAAENLANPLSVLKASIGDVAESIGANLLPLIKGVTSKIVDIAEKIQDWAKEHPVLAKTLTLVALGVGAVLTVIGGLILAMPVITSMVAAFGVVFHAALGPIGLISLAIAGLIAAGILLWKNWDKVTAFFGKAWQNIKIVFLTGIKVILDGLVKFAGWLPGIGNKIEQLRDKVANMLETEQVKKDAAEIKRTAEELTKSIKTEFEKQALEIQSSFDKQKQAAQSAYNAAVKAINKEYGIGEAAKNVSETRIEAAKRATEEVRESYAREKDAARDRYDIEMAKIRAVYNAKMEALNLETDATIKALQDQIDAIDAQTEAEGLAATRAEEAKRLSELKAAYDSAQTAEEKAKAKEEWDKYAVEVARRELLRGRDAEKDLLRQQIADARLQAEDKRDQIKKEEDTELASLKIRYEANIKNIDMLSERLDGDLKVTLARIEQDRVAKIDAENAKLNAEIARLDKAEQEEVQFYADQLSRSNQQVKDINVAYDSLKKRYDIEIVTHEVTADTGQGVTIGPFTGTNEEWERRRIEGFAQGGIVSGPVGMPQLAMVHGGEAIIPNDELWGGTININIDSFTANSERDVDMLAEKIVKLIRVRTGLK